jgi:zinc-ribbon domain
VSGYGLEYAVVAFFFGLATGVVGKIKGSSFLIWFLVGAVLPFLGLIAAIASRWEKAELRRRCDECGAILSITDQVCKRCGRDLDFPSEAIAPRLRSAR